MKFFEIFRFEFAYQARRPWTWLFALVLIAICFLMTRDNAASQALPEDFLINTPFMIVATTVFGTLMWLMMAATVAGDAAARDIATGMHPLIYTSPLTRASYLGGRFVAAFALNALILTGVQIGILSAVYLPGTAPEVIGPFRPAAYLSAYVVISLPNAFVASSIQFAVALKSGRAMAAYFGSFLLFFLGFFIASFILYNKGLGAVIDPIGIRFIVEDIAHSWTSVEKRTRLVGFEGIVLTNRLFWLCTGLVTVLGTFITFRFTHRVGGFSLLRWAKQRPSADVAPSTAGALTDSRMAPAAPRYFGFLVHTRQTIAIAAASFRHLTTSYAGMFFLVAIPLMTIPVIVDQMEFNGVPLTPVTARVISEITASISSELSRWVIIPALIIFFAGELVWHEREARIHEITDAMPGSEWAPFLGKLSGLALLLGTFTTLQMGAAITGQALLGYKHFEIGLYLKILFGLQLPEYLMFAVLTLSLHVIVNHKYFGHMVCIIVYVFIAMPEIFGIEHNLLVFGAGPRWSYTEMRGFGSSIVPWLWFRLYWAAWAVLIAVAAKTLWVRGNEGALAFRLRVARHRLAGQSLWIAAVAIAAILNTGGLILYNTDVLNQYSSRAALKERAARYENLYGKYESVPQPETSHTKLAIEFYPKDGKAEITGLFNLVNRTQVPIDCVHVAVIPGVETETTFQSHATLALRDDSHGHRIYTLESPLQPGDSLMLHFKISVGRSAFSQSGFQIPVRENGTFLMNKDWFPAIGYQKARELSTASDRREHGLTARPLIAFLNDEDAYKYRGRGITFEAVVGTDHDQLAVAPGRLLRSWTENGRSYFEYSTGSGHAIGGEWSFFSARYAIRQAEWVSPVTRKHVVIRLYHHPEHTSHIDATMEGVKSILDYYSNNFGEYTYNFLTIAERPGNGVGMHADAGMISHGEGFTHWRPRESGHHHPFAIIAHEVAHQWTVPYAAVEGAPVMSESIAWYYGIKAVEHIKGPVALRKLLAFMRQPHPYSPIRRGEPLLRGLDPYLSYRKGPFALYSISHYVGEEKVNEALRTLLENHRRVGTPLATTLDLYKQLERQTPDSLKYLLHDLFEVNTNWKFRTTRAAARPLNPDSTRWELTLAIDARKVVTDSAGVTTDVPMNEWVDLGVFGTSEEDGPQRSLYLHRHRIRSGRQTITVLTTGKPSRAGIDPGHVLDWEERSEDNMKEVTYE